MSHDDTPQNVLCGATASPLREGIRSGNLAKAGPGSPGPFLLRSVFFRFEAAKASTTSANAVERDRASAEKDQGEGNRRQRKRQLISPVPQQTIPPVHLPDGHAEVNTNGQGGKAGEESSDDRNPAEELRPRREIGPPAWQAQAADHLNMMGEAAKNLGVSMTNHDHAQHHAQDEQRQRLKTVEVEHDVPPTKDQQITAFGITPLFALLRPFNNLRTVCSTLVMFLAQSSNPVYKHRI